MRRLIIPTLAVVFGVALIALLAFGLTSKSASRSFDDALADGVLLPAPVKSLPLLSGDGKSSLAAFRGKVVVLNFWASWCPPCQAEAPALERTERLLVRHDATVLGVTYDDTAPDSEGFVRQYGLTYPELRDVTGSYAHDFGTDQLPESFVIDREGRVAAISRGEVDQSFLNRAVALAATS